MAMSSGSPSDGAHPAEFADHTDQAAAQQGLAPGEADLGDAQRHEQARHAQVVGDGHLGELRAVIPERQ